LRRRWASGARWCFVFLGQSSTAIGRAGRALRRRAVAWILAGGYPMKDFSAAAISALTSRRLERYQELWPQSMSTQPWNSDVKNELEDRLHKLVCDGSMSLEQAQREIATDWIAAYLKHVGPSPNKKP
jgi:hypothetical protein